MAVQTKQPSGLPLPVCSPTNGEKNSAAFIDQTASSHHQDEKKKKKLMMIGGSDGSPTKIDLSESAGDTDAELDPWAMPELQDTGESWAELTTGKRIHRVFVVIGKLLSLMLLLYIFFCSLDFLSSAFRLLGGKAAGEFFRNSQHLKNPVVGLMLGILATVLVQSSSTSTSIVVTMVASNFLEVPTAIPIIMGANIGTSVTNTLVSLAQSSDRAQFRRAFAGATVHDMFNWMTVLVLLPLEAATGYLYHLTSALVNAFEWKTNKEANKEMLTVLTKPFTDLIIRLDKKVINALATGDTAYYNRSLIKEWCKYEVHKEFVNVTTAKNISSLIEGVAVNSTQNITELQENKIETGIERCAFMLNGTGLGDSWIGLILLAISLVLLCGCLILMVKVLHSMLRGQMAMVIKKTLNADFPGRLGFLTGYVAMLVGMGMTILVQSSSIFTSALTPLVGLGVISVERVYPLTLGSNIGTTTTGILASLAGTGNELKHSIQIALCHLFFNISGIILFYPIPFMRIPIYLSKQLGNITANYRWFSIVYLVAMFFLLPAAIFSLSMAGSLTMIVVSIPVIIIIVLVIIINVLQRKLPTCLPPFLRTWERFPLWMHSLEPWDRLIVSTTGCLFKMCSCCTCCPCCKEPPNYLQSNQLAYLYNKPSCQSQSAILNASLRTVPSNVGLVSLHTVPSGDGIDNPAMVQSSTSV
ncbi:hypothetical protein CHUAL_000883 [Chamberlinius hualienensis]